MGKAKRKINRNRVEQTLVFEEKNKKPSQFNKVKKYISLRWFQPNWKNILVITISFFGLSFILAYPLGLLIDNYMLAYTLTHTFVTSFIIVFYNSRGERKTENIIEFFVRWIMIAVVLLILSLLASNRFEG